MQSRRKGPASPLSRHLKENAALWGHRVHGTAEQQDWKPGMERSHADEQISAVHSGHIKIEDRKSDGQRS